MQISGLSHLTQRLDDLLEARQQHVSPARDQMEPGSRTDGRDEPSMGDRDVAVLCAVPHMDWNPHLAQ